MAFHFFGFFWKWSLIPEPLSSLPFIYFLNLMPFPHFFEMPVIFATYVFFFAPLLVIIHKSEFGLFSW